MSRENPKTKGKGVGFYNKSTGMFLYEGEFTYLLSPVFPKEEIKLRYMKYNVLKFLNKGGNPRSISIDLGIRRPTVLQHLDELEKVGLVDSEKENGKRKYACPHLITEKGKFLVEKSVGFLAKPSRVGQTKRGTLKGKEDDINSHAFVFTLVIPKELLSQWEDRRKILDEKEIDYEKLSHFFGKTEKQKRGEKLIINGRKIHFTNKSIVIYDSAEYIASLSKKGKSKAVYHFQVFLRMFEKILGMNLKQKMGGSYGYKFRVSRQHHALIQNSLAKQYNARNKKLEVRNARGRLMYLIDNSPTLENPKGENHFEAVDPKTSDEDITPAQNFFKKLVKTPMTTEDIQYNFNENMKDREGINKNILELSVQSKKNADNLGYFGENMVSHVSAIKAIEVRLGKMDEREERLVKAIEKLAGNIK